MSEEAPEPWTVNKLKCTVKIPLSAYRYVTVYAGTLSNARRIVACVNALAGIPIETIEALPKGELLRLIQGCQRIGLAVRWPLDQQVDSEGKSEGKFTIIDDIKMPGPSERGCKSRYLWGALELGQGFEIPIAGENYPNGQDKAVVRLNSSWRQWVKYHEKNFQFQVVKVGDVIRVKRIA